MARGFELTDNVSGYFSLSAPQLFTACDRLAPNP